MTKAIFQTTPASAFTLPVVIFKRIFITHNGVSLRDNFYSAGTIIEVKQPGVQACDGVGF
jgi:hypothetical protein